MRLRDYPISESGEFCRKCASGTEYAILRDVPGVGAVCEACVACNECETVLAPERVMHRGVAAIPGDRARSFCDKCHAKYMRLLSRPLAYWFDLHGTNSKHILERNSTRVYRLRKYVRLETPGSHGRFVEFGLFEFSFVIHPRNHIFPPKSRKHLLRSEKEKLHATYGTFETVKNRNGVLVKRYTVLKSTVRLFDGMHHYYRIPAYFHGKPVRLFMRAGYKIVTRRERGRISHEGEWPEIETETPEAYNPEVVYEVGQVENKREDFVIPDFASEWADDIPEFDGAGVVS